MNHKIGSEEITRLRYEKGAIKYEDEITNLETLDDLDDSLVEQYMKDITQDTSIYSIPFVESLKVDTSTLLPDDAVAAVVEAYELSSRSVN